jgi:hypothetical protein
LLDQPHAITVALKTEAVAVVFDLVKPVGASRNGLGGGRQAKLEFGHWPDIDGPAEDYESRKVPGPKLTAQGPASHDADRRGPVCPRVALKQARAKSEGFPNRQPRRLRGYRSVLMYGL